MTLVGLTRRFRPGRGPAGGSPDLIGSEGAPPACPRCSRPLARATGRCPGCRSFLLGGIRLRAAFTFVTVGVALGGLGGGAFVAALIGGGGPAQAPAALASPTPVATPVATPVHATVVVPPRARTGFAQARAVNERLAHSASLLRKAVLARASAGEIAAILRKISADGTYGGQVAIRLAGWPPSLSLADRLASFYADLAASARSGLANALWDDAAYLAGARSTLRVLRALGPVSVATLGEAVAHGLVEPAESATP